MFCQNCGSEINQENKFCGKCGNPVSPYIPYPFTIQYQPLQSLQPPTQPTQVFLDKKGKVKDSPLSTVSGLLGCFGYFVIFVFVGIIVGIVDIAKNDLRYRHRNSWIGIVGGTLSIILSFAL